MYIFVVYIKCETYIISKTFMFSYEFLFLYKNLQSIINYDIFYKYKKRIKINK